MTRCDGHLLDGKLARDSEYTQIYGDQLGAGLDFSREKKEGCFVLRFARGILKVLHSHLPTSFLKPLQCPSILCGILVYSLFPSALFFQNTMPQLTIKLPTINPPTIKFHKNPAVLKTPNILLTILGARHSFINPNSRVL